MVRLIKTETVISVLMGHFIKKLLFILLFVGVLIAPANAQNEKNMYSYKKIGNKYIVSINNHTEIVKAPECFLQGERNSVGFYQRDWCYRRADPPFLQSQDKSI
ncbi:hypothetical protein NXX78_01930 [Bacteroides fragilis]|nr:hypothetical protein [Bacteroides fragilis]